ncbi:hypothetical protein A7A76_19460 [Lysobacter enzymogenes]|nr:hypothetical protein [Lysobacter enzymogenes]
MSIPVDYGGKKIDKRLYDGSYALIVGASDYQILRKLPDVKIESGDLADALAAQGFKVRMVCDPTAGGDGGLSEVGRFFDQYGKNGNNRLLVFLSGHGWVDRDNHGYFAAVESVNPRTDENAAKRQGFSSERMIELTRRVKTRHLLVVVDACYSASFFTNKSAIAMPTSTSVVDFEAASQPAKWFLTAGDAGQETPSPSIFLPALLLGISGYADLMPTDGIVRGSELAAYVRHVVANSQGPQTTPNTGYIPIKGGSISDDRGDPMFRYDPAMKEKAADHIRSAGLQYLIDRDPPRSESDGWPDPRYQLIYFRKEADGDKVLAAMKNARLPYLSTRPVLAQTTRTNGIACRRGAPVAVVKAAARGLIQNGVPLRIIDQGFKRGQYDIQLLHFGRVADDRFRDLTLQDLDALDAYKTCPNEFVFRAEPKEIVQ